MKEVSHILSSEEIKPNVKLLEIMPDGQNSLLQEVNDEDIPVDYDTLSSIPPQAEYPPKEEHMEYEELEEAEFPTLPPGLDSLYAQAHMPRAYADPTLVNRPLPPPPHVVDPKDMVEIVHPHTGPHGHLKSNAHFQRPPPVTTPEPHVVGCDTKPPPPSPTEAPPPPPTEPALPPTTEAPPRPPTRAVEERVVHIDDVASPHRTVVIWRRIDEFTETEIEKQETDVSPPEVEAPAEEEPSEAPEPSSHSTHSSREGTPEEAAEAAAEEQAPEEPAEAKPVAAVKSFPKNKMIVEQPGGGQWIHLSDQSNPGGRWCWHLTREANRSTKNWAHLVEFQRCLDAKIESMPGTGDLENKLRYQISEETEVCTEQGGMELTIYRDEPQSIYHVACIDQHMAMASTDDACFAAASQSDTTVRLMKLSKEQEKKFCARNILPEPLYDHLHLWARSHPSEGGIAGLDDCTGSYYYGAVVQRIRPIDVSDGTGASTSFGMARAPHTLMSCIPIPPQPSYQCRGVGVGCRIL
eukprot:Selendium_serpulae@DN8970_c0_g1_i1.p1